MKKIEEIIKQTPVFLNNWKSKFSVIANFEDIHITEEEYNSSTNPYYKERKKEMKQAIEKWKDINILFASYGCANYSGKAFVLFEKNGKLFEVYGSHCSCYGIEGQFEPEESILEDLYYRLTKGNLGNDDYCGNEFAKELKEFLGIEL